MDIGAFETFLSERIKVNGKAGVEAQCVALSLLHGAISPQRIQLTCFRAGNLGDDVKISRDKSKVTVTSESSMSKR